MAVILDSLEEGSSRIWNNWRMDNQEMPSLKGIKLQGADLSSYDLNAVEFDYADLSEADLTSSELSGAIFYKANLSNIEMPHASAYGAQFRKADLSGANLVGSTFNSSGLNGAKLTGSKLNGISRSGWEIEGVECDYVYTELFGKGRFPKDRDFEPGEFEKIYKSYPLIDLEFHEKFDALTILIVNYAAIELNSEDGKYDFQVKEISAYGNTPTIKVSVRSNHQIKEGTEVLKERVEMLESQLAERQINVDKLYGLLGEALSKPSLVHNTFNSEVSIEQFISGNNYSHETNIAREISSDSYYNLVNEIESSDLPETDKSLAKKLLEELKNTASEEAVLQIKDWTKTLTQKGLEQLPQLLSYLL